MSNNQEVNINLAKDIFMNKERRKAKDMLVLIIRTGIIKLDIQNWQKRSCHVESSRWRRERFLTHISPMEHYLKQRETTSSNK
jgi:hypothetical protein